MAHFAELDANNVVLRVVVINNKDTSDANGIEKEHIGAAFCEKLFGGIWKQTSYNGNIRKNYAGIGYIYKEDIDAFVISQPYKSWSLDSNANWQPPVPMPIDENMYSWNEDNQVWEIKNGT